RRAPIVLALLGAPAVAAGAAAGRELAGWLCLFSAISAPLGRCWLRLRAWAYARLLVVLRTANGRFCGIVQLPADELDDDAAHELGDGPRSSSLTSASRGCRAGAATLLSLGAGPRSERSGASRDPAPS